jgi:hypothetical protein
MNCPERVAGHVGAETVKAAGLFQRRGTAAAIAAGAAELTRNLPRPRSLDPDFTDWDPDDMDTWDERIVMVADDEDLLDWQRDWLAENGRG